MSSEAGTPRQAAGAPGPGAERAGALVDEAEELLAPVVPPGAWPTANVIERFLAGDALGRVLSLYDRAMALEPDEAALPWNLASALRRLGLHDLALTYVTRAIAAAERTGDLDLAGPDAHLALAEIAVDAGRPDLAALAIARARQLGGGRGVLADRLLDVIRTADADVIERLQLAAELVRAEQREA